MTDAAPVDRAAETNTTNALLPRAHRPLSEIAADIEKLRQERESAIAEMNAHRQQDLTRAYTIADVAERIRQLQAEMPGEPLRVWFADPRTGELRAATSVHSWRGAYQRPAIGGASFTKEFDLRRDDGSTYNQQYTAATALEALSELTTDVFQGWKGGDYTYQETDTLLLDDRGDYSGENVIVGVVLFTPDAPNAPTCLMLVHLNLDDA